MRDRQQGMDEGEKQTMSELSWNRSKEEVLLVQAHKLYLEAENIYMYTQDIVHGGNGKYIHSNESSYDQFPKAIERVEKQLEIVKASWKECNGTNKE